MAFTSRSFLFFGLVLFLIASLVQGGLFDKKKDEEEEKYTGKENANIGFQGLQDALRDPTALKEVMKMANDPEIMKQAKAMANDPEFKREVDKWMNSDAVKKSMKAAEEIAKDPKKLALFQKQLEDIVKSQKREYTGADNAKLGMNVIGDTFRDPKAMKETMMMLKDPETVREVEKMMKDPMFQAEMKRMTTQPQFKAALERAKEITAEITSDPKKLKEFQNEMAAMMGSLKNELGSLKSEL